MERLVAARIACGALNEIGDLVDHPQLRTIGHDAPSGPVEVIAPPVEVQGTQDAYRPVPKLGEHSKKIRAEFSA